MIEWHASMFPPQCISVVVQPITKGHRIEGDIELCVQCLPSRASVGTTNRTIGHQIIQITSDLKDIRRYLVSFDISCSWDSKIISEK